MLEFKTVDNYINDQYIVIWNSLSRVSEAVIDLEMIEYKKTLILERNI